MFIWWYLQSRLHVQLNHVVMSKKMECMQTIWAYWHEKHWRANFSSFVHTSVNFFWARPNMLQMDVFTYKGRLHTNFKVNFTRIEISLSLFSSHFRTLAKLSNVKLNCLKIWHMWKRIIVQTSIPNLAVNYWAISNY